jgi:MFS family permease
MQHAVLASRTIITAQTTDAERATQLGYVGAAYGIGFAIGPALGGQLSSYSLQTAAWAAAATSLLGTAAIWILLPSGMAMCALETRQNGKQMCLTK